MKIRRKPVVTLSRILARHTVALDPGPGQLPEPMMLLVVMLRVPPSCLGQLGCEGLAVMGCVESAGRAVEAWHLSSRLFPAGSRMNTA
jgi:hypothetical protein